MWLTNVHPVTWKHHLIDLIILSHLGEDLPLDRSWSVLNPVYYRNVEQVEACVDLVRDENLWLLNKLFDFVILVRDDNAIFGWILYFSHHNRALATVRFVELNQLVEWVVANDVGVEDEEEA